MTDLTGKVAIITGAASGIGAAAARRFAADGARVVIADLNETDGRAVADELDGTFVRTDVARDSDLETLVLSTVERHGRLDVYFGNAGVVGPVGSIMELDADEFDRTLAIDLRSIALGMKYSARVMTKQKSGGSIISTASVAALQGGLGPLVYSAAKGGIVALTRSVALELASNGVRVNSIAPGGVITNFHSAGLEADAAAVVRAQIAEALAHGQPIQRAGLPDDMASAAAFLASDESSFVTGQVIVVDGGLTSTYGGALAVRED